MQVTHYTEFLDHIDDLNKYIEEIEKENRDLKQELKDKNYYIKSLEMDNADKDIHIIAMHSDLDRLDELMHKQELKIEKYYDIIKIGDK